MGMIYVFLSLLQKIRLVKSKKFQLIIHNGNNGKGHARCHMKIQLIMVCLIIKPMFISTKKEIH